MRFHLEPNKRVIIALGVMCVVGLGLAFYVHRLQQAQRVAWQAKLDAKQQEAKDIETSAKQLPETEIQLADTQHRLSFLRGSAPQDYQPSLLTRLTQLAAECGVKLESFAPSEDPAGATSPIAKVRKDVAPHTYFNITAAAHGSFHNAARFLYRLTGFEKIVAVNSLQLQPQANGAPDDVRLALQMTAYVISDIRPEVMAAVAALKDVAAAEEKYKTAHQGYGDLAALVADGLTTVTEKDSTVAEGYVITTDASSGKDKFKILATATKKNTGLDDFSIDQTAKVFDETTQAGYE